MSSLIYQHFIKPMNDFYGRDPYGHGFAQRLREFDDLTAEQLEDAATRLIERPNKKSYPALNECKDALRGVRHARPAKGLTGFTKERYASAALSFIKARGRAEAITPKDEDAWSCWKAYFSRLSMTGFLGLDHMRRIENGEFHAMTVPTRTPAEFDATAPTIADIAAAQMARERRATADAQRMGEAA